MSIFLPTWLEIKIPMFIGISLNEASAAATFSRRYLDANRRTYMVSIRESQPIVLKPTFITVPYQHNGGYL